MLSELLADLYLEPSTIILPSRSKAPFSKASKISSLAVWVFAMLSESALLPVIVARSLYPGSFTFIASRYFCIAARFFK